MFSLNLKWQFWPLESLDKISLPDGVFCLFVCLFCSFFSLLRVIEMVVSLARALHSIALCYFGLLSLQLVRARVVSWKLAGLIMIKGCEFEPRYGQRVVSLGNSIHLPCFVDQSDIWYAVGGNVTIQVLTSSARDGFAASLDEAK